ncbi:hypothetical protein [Nocardioides ungokensis]|uniref:hypothetical protein n=1 Tax=Nocardioides ungokensis TaxID=1643322 RepID=UPI0015DEF3F6|nr:hypothetical protein [Nocardioides ungokensis]
MGNGDVYVVWGYIAGAVLPPNLEFDGPEGGDWLCVTQDVPDSFRRLDPPGVVEAQLGGGTWATGTGRRTRVRSAAVFKVSVRVVDPDDAMRTAEAEVLPRLLAVVSAMTGSPMFGAPVAFHAANEPEQWLPRRSDAWVDAFTPRQFKAEEADPDEWAGVVWAAQHDYTARHAAVDMYVANNRYLSHGDDAADVRTALLTYFFVLERIADRIGRFFPPKPTPDESAPLVETLEKALDRATSVEQKVECVRVAAQKLQALHSRGIKRRVVEAGGTIDVDENVVRTAGQFADLRNSQLGHVPSAGETAKDLVGWLPKAQQCAHAYLSAYLRWVEGRDQAASD